MEEHPPEPDDASARRIFDRFFQPLCQFFYRQGVSREDSQDLAQDTLLRVIRGLEGFKKESRLKTWVFAIARNVWLNSFRGKRPEMVRLDEEDSEDEGAGPGRRLADPALSPEERALTQREVERLRAALEDLPSRMQQALRLHLQGLTYGDVARLMQISTGAAKSHVSAAKDRLKKHLLSSSEGAVFEGLGPEQPKERP